VGKKVLVVEDSATMRSLIVSTLEELNGVEVIEVPNGFEALRMLPSQPFDLILTDINMPEINGLEIVNFVKGHPQYKSIPLVIVSTEQGEEDIKKGMALGAAAYVTKPFDPARLKEIVLSIIRL
jgi:two-component system chemotaxis response regulator CheY